MMIDEYKKVIDDFVNNPIDWHKNSNHPIHKHEVMYFGMMAKEILALRKENKTLQQTTDMQHETTISDLKLIGKLQHENKEWIEDVKGLSELFHENPIIHEIISTGEKYYLYEIDKETVDAVHDKHKALVQKYNKTT